MSIDKAVGEAETRAHLSQDRIKLSGNKIQRSLKQKGTKEVVIFSFQGSDSRTSVYYDKDGKWTAKIANLEGVETGVEPIDSLTSLYMYHLLEERRAIREGKESDPMSIKTKDKADLLGELAWDMERVQSEINGKAI
jgi:hypothetical protein